MTEIESEKGQHGEKYLYYICLFVGKANKMLCKISFYIFSILSLFNEYTFILEKREIDS